MFPHDGAGLIRSNVASISEPRGTRPGGSDLDLLRAGLFEGEGAGNAWDRWLLAGGSPPSGPARRLLPLAEWNLRRLGILAAGTATGRPGTVEEAWVQQEGIADAAASLIGSLSRVVSRVVVIKGLALAAHVYPHRALRPMGDVDLLVPEGEFGAAVGCLEAEGWRAVAREPASRMLHLHGQAFAGPAPMEVDLHRHALMESCAGGADAGFLARSVPFVSGDVRAWTLSPADHLLSVCVHGLRWSPVPPVHWVADAVLLLRREPAALDWDVLVSEARARDLCLPLLLALNFLGSEFGAAVPTEVLANLRRHSRGWRRRLEVASRMRRPSLLRGVFLHWRASSGELKALPLGERIRAFPTYLREMWGLHQERELPLALLKKIRSRLRWRAA